MDYRKNIREVRRIILTFRNQVGSKKSDILGLLERTRDISSCFLILFWLLEFLGEIYEGTCESERFLGIFRSVEQKVQRYEERPYEDDSILIQTKTLRLIFHLQRA